MKSLPSWIYKHRGSLIIPPLVFALVCFWGETENPWLTWPLGLGLLLAGTALRIWAQQHVQHRLRRPMQLTTSGPYQFVRNPLYIGSTLVYVSAAVLSELVWLAPIVLLWCAALYSFVVRDEEADLLRLYGGAYSAYRSEVPRWLPRWRTPAPLGPINPHFRAAILSEAHCALIVLPFLFKEMVERFFEH